MIRINLISEGRRPVVARKAKSKLTLGEQDPSLYILTAGLVVGLLVALGFYLSLNSDLEQQREKVAKAQKEKEALAPILKEVEDFKKKRRRLQQKIEIIEGLNSQRRGPVTVMDEVSQALPELVWLSSMEVRGKTVRMKAQTLNWNSIAAFIENLKRVETFAEPNTSNIRSSASNSYTFDLSFNFTVPKPEQEEGEEGDDEAAADAA
ncbi:MAG: PilN domain-containing protein [Acidobacteriota bacterium]